MKKRGLIPTDATYTALFNACAESPWKDSGLQHALKLREELMNKNVPLNPITYRSLLKVCTLSSGLQGGGEVFKVWRQMLLMGVKPDVNTYNLLIRATRDCGIGDAAEALHLLTQPMDLPTLTLSAGKEEQDKKSRQDKKSLQVKKSKDSPQEMGQQMLLDDSSVTSGTYNTAVGLVGSQTLAVVRKADHFPSEPSFDTSNRPNLLDLSINTEKKVVSLANVNTPSDRLALIGDLGGILQKMKEDNVCPTIKTFTLLAEVV
ncbi:unnamed protein product [Ranitomeya imitator]|uniref:Pentatricopeptide repeat-containing protein n=1 Tax=Ranitomeya imitator TaxID=111125 RepID=A0ABN9LXT8_9NEOB|nr:unnamed protein product [Ranitomeya imitator]